MSAFAIDVIHGREPWSLERGDCVAALQSLPDKSVQHVITDPPYSAHVHGSQRAGVGRPADGWKGAPIARDRDLGFASLSSTLRWECAREFARIAERWVVVFSDTESAHLWREALEASGLEYVRTCFWRKKNGAPQFTGDRPAVACEAITVCHVAGRKRWNGGGKQGFYDVPIVITRGAGEIRVHPTQKPLVLMRQLVEDFTDAGEIICDPFAGSGTTGAACAPDRRFVGWELDEAHHEVAVARLSGAAYERPKPAQVNRQADLFGGGVVVS